MAVAAVVILVCAAASYCLYGGDEDTDYRPGSWANTSVVGNLPDTAPDASDDLFASVNYVWLSTTEMPAGQSRYGDLLTRNDENRKALIAALEDPSVTGEAADQLRAVYGMLSDMEARDALGYQPLVPFVDAIESISTLEDLADYIVDGDKLYMPFVAVDYMTDLGDSTRGGLVVDAASLNLPDPHYYLTESAYADTVITATESAFAGMAELMGYSAEEAEEINANTLEVERMVAMAIASAGDDIDQVAAGELAGMWDSFPLDSLLAAYGAQNNTTVTTTLAYIDAVDAALTAENLEAVKDFLLRYTVLAASQYLDSAFLELNRSIDIAVTGTSGARDPGELAGDAVMSLMQDQAATVFVDACFDPSVVADVEGMVMDMISTYREMVSANGWLSDESKAAVIAKLDNMVVNVADPGLTFFEGMVIPGYADGGDALKALVALKDNARHRISQCLSDNPARGELPVGCNAEANAFYYARDNSVNIMAGFLTSDANYDPDDTLEGNMGRLGQVIAHEISHAFDPDGCQFDEFGNYLFGGSILSDEDAVTYQGIVERFSEYLSGITVAGGQNLDGDFVLGEAVADLCGMEATMHYASSDPDFDYKEFFESFAAFWRMMYTEERAVHQMAVDTHPPEFVRTNVTAQMFREFHDAFGVTEGDGMWIAPEDRVSIWA